MILRPGCLAIWSPLSNWTRSVNFTRRSLPSLVFFNRRMCPVSQPFPLALFYCSSHDIIRLCRYLRLLRGEGCVRLCSIDLFSFASLTLLVCVFFVNDHDASQPYVNTIITAALYIENLRPRPVGICFELKTFLSCSQRFIARAFTHSLITSNE